MSKRQPLKFQSFSSSIDVGFWRELNQRKVDLYKADETPMPLVGAFATSYVRGPKHKPVKARFVLDATSFSPETYVVPVDCYPVDGVLYNTNTLDGFKRLDKRALFEKLGRVIFDDIVSGNALIDPFLLTRFLFISHADLKKFHYCYLFGSPILPLESPALLLRDSKPLTDFFATSEVDDLLHAANEMNPKCFVYLFKKNTAGLQLGQISSWETFWEGKPGEEHTLFFHDPSPLATAAGWPLRNLLLLLRLRFGVQRLNIISHNCLRDVVFSIHIPPAPTLAPGAPVTLPEAVGWEPNLKGRVGPRFLDLGRMMDPVRLAENAVDLNIKLMKWRLLPQLQANRLAATKALLLGAGTLGCAVARTLLAYGVRNLTLVDSGVVSFSNPVRQSLFHFSDSVEGLAKVDAAVRELRTIFPSVNATGVNLQIPMPGHPEKDKRKVGECVEKLIELIRGHDVIFLLTDTRESRWLPTLLCAYFEKLAINAALGFDSFLVMRHGFVESPLASQPAPSESGLSPRGGTDEFLKRTATLGCYFCNDIVAPNDSTTNRALDQLCTITRPSLAPIAGSLAVELFASVVHHSLGPRAPANADCDLGIIPHQIRGWLSHFNNVILEGARFESCSGCGIDVLNEFHRSGMNFLFKAFDSPSYLEEICGLAKLKEQTAGLLLEDDVMFEETLGDDDFDDGGWLLT